MNDTYSPPPPFDIADILVQRDHARFKNPYEAGYLLAAIRGPDNPSKFQQKVKEIVTSRIRGILFNHHAGVFMKTPLTPADIETVAKAISSVKVTTGPLPQLYIGWEHFSSHIVPAIRASAENPIWGDLAAPLVSTILYRKLPVLWKEQKAQWKEDHPKVKFPEPEPFGETCV